MRGRILYFRCKSNRFVSISKCRLRADRVATPRKGPKHGDFCAKVGGFDRRSWRFFDEKPRVVLRNSTGSGRFSAVFYMLRSRFECIISQIGAYIPVFLRGGWRELCRYGGSAIGPRRMCGERRARGATRRSFRPRKSVPSARKKEGDPAAHPRPRRKCATSRDFHLGRYYILGRFALHFLVFPLLLQYALSPHL